MEQTNPNLLEEFESTANLLPVSPGIRLVNYIIDIIAIYALLLILGFVFGAATALAADPTVDDGSWASDIQLLLLGGFLFSIILYYTLFEFAAKGRTLGKMATGTVALREDGSPLTFKDAFLRSLCRFIPFEFISALGFRPWHDSLTHTMVVKKAKRF